MLNVNQTEKKIRECLFDLRNNSRNPRHLEEIGCLISENLNRVRNSKKKTDNDLRCLSKKDVEIIENLLSCIQKTEEAKNDNADLNKREKKFKKTIDKDRKSKKQARISRDVRLKKAASEMSSEKELVVLHKPQPKSKKRIRKQKIADTHNSVKPVSLSNVLCLPEPRDSEDKSVKAGKSQTIKDLKNSANNSVLLSVKSEISIRKDKMTNKIDDLENLVSELDTAVNLSHIIIKQLDVINKNKKDITSNGARDRENVSSPEVVTDCSVDSKCFNVKEDKSETTDKKNVCGDSLLKCSDPDGKRNSYDSRKYSKQSIAGDKKNLKKDNSNLLDLKSVLQKTSNTDTKLNNKDSLSKSRKSKGSRAKEGEKTIKNNDVTKSTLSSSDVRKNSINRKGKVLSDKTIAILKVKSKIRLNTSSECVSEEKSRIWPSVNDDNKIKSEHNVGEKVKLSRHSKNNCRTSSNSFKSGENNCNQVVSDKGIESNLTLNLKRNKPCTNFKLSEAKISLNDTGLNEDVNNISSLHESVCNSSEVKSIVQRDGVNVSKLEEKSTQSLNDRIDISINKSSKNSSENVLSVVIKHKKSVQSSRVTHKGNKCSNVYLLGNKISNAQGYTIVPQSYKIEKDSYTICEHTVQSSHFGSSFSQDTNKTARNVLKIPLTSNPATLLKESEFKSRPTYGKLISEYQSGLKQEGFFRSRNQSLNAFAGKHLSRRKFKSQAVMSTRQNFKYINNDYISVANVRVPINFGKFNSNKLQYRNSNNKLRMIRKKSSTSVGRYFCPKRNYFMKNSGHVQNKMQFGETFHSRKCSSPLGKFFFHIDLESTDRSKPFESGAGNKNTLGFQNRCVSSENESRFFTIIDDSSELYRKDGAGTAKNDVKIIENKRPFVRWPEIKRTESLAKEKIDLNAENVLNTCNEYDGIMCSKTGNAFFTIVEENKLNEPENKVKVINEKCNFVGPEVEKDNFVRVIDGALDENNLKKTSPKENVDTYENKQNISGKAGIFENLFFENYKKEFFMKVVDSKSESKTPTCSMIDAEIQTDFVQTDFSTVQQLFAEELKLNRQLFIKNLDEPNNESSEKEVPTHYEAILQLVNNLFEITLNKVGCIDGGVITKRETSKTPEHDIISKLNNIVEIVQNIEKNNVSKRDFVKVIESENDVGERKQSGNMGKLNGTTQTNGSGDCTNVPLMKAQILLSQFNIYSEMVDMLKNCEETSSAKVETVNEIRKIIDGIAGSNKNNFCKIRSSENLRTDHDLAPYPLSIKGDCRLPLVENRNNFVTVVQENTNQTTESKTTCQNRNVPVYPVVESASDLRKKNPFFVVVDPNVSDNSSDRQDVGYGEPPVENSKHFGGISPEKFNDESKKKRIPINQPYLLDENINVSNKKNPFFVILDENEPTSNRIEGQEKTFRKTPEITNRKLSREFLYKQSSTNSEIFCKMPKCNVGMKAVQKESSSGLTIKDIYRKRVKSDFFCPRKSQNREKENVEKEFLNSLTYFNQDKNYLNELSLNSNEIKKKEKVVNKFQVVSVENDVNNSASIGIQTDLPAVSEEQKTIVEHSEDSIKLDTLNKQERGNRRNVQDSDLDHSVFKEDKWVSIIFSKGTQSNVYDQNETRNITSQTGSTFVQNSKTYKNSGFKSANERRTNETFLLGKDINKTFESNNLFEKKETELKRVQPLDEQRNNFVYFNKSVKTRHCNSENLNSSLDLFKTETENVPNSKMKTDVADNYSKLINSSLEFKRKTNQNRIDYKDIFNDYQNDDCFSFDMDEYKNEILLNTDLSDSDFTEEEDSSNWLTIQNINCIQTDSCESVDKRIMRLQMDLRLNECLQIELSSDSTFDTVL